MGVVLQSGFREELNRLDLGVGHRLGAPTHADQVGDADCVEDPEALNQREAGEAISGKERKGDLLAAILPPAPPLDERQEGLNFAADELIAHHLLVTRARANHVPMWHTSRIGDRRGLFACEIRPLEIARSRRGHYEKKSCGL